jgi:hypothetical protein
VDQWFLDNLHGSGLQRLVGNITVGRAREDYYGEIDIRISRRTLIRPTVA